MSKESMLPVWLFIGMLLLVYGVIILVTSLREWSHPPAVVLSQLHPGVWAGIVLILIGGFYILRFRPRSRGREPQQ